ncbi:hypothetical protein BDP55DRAFT_730440 [Colletotrichum godetiae]|uniref:Uncharacterized protein n=1 Tax=Colletotrichum godetiae TaxID=1209918 RepID=A0AAJ0ES98_9PEZI|nr:uncharacterized protein BDP55DRAFT_730440 [Colletotrichum godetiae]KAK1673642.1 hypothetical protein BDP55DRAFT_730440 [Colletotrichum godetiae]
MDRSNTNSSYLMSELNEEQRQTLRTLANLSEANFGRATVLATLHMISRGSYVTSTPLREWQPPSTTTTVPDNLDIENLPGRSDFCNDASCPFNSFNSPANPSDNSAPQNAARGFFFGDGPIFTLDHELCEDYTSMCGADYYYDLSEYSDPSEPSGDDSQVEDLDNFGKISVDIDDYVYLEADGHELDSEGLGLPDLRYDFESMVCTNEEDENED